MRAVGRASSSRGCIPDEGLEPIRAACDVDLWEDELPPPRDELLRRVAGCDGVLTLLTDRVDDEFLDAAGPQLKVVSNYAVGFDNIDVAACARRGIAVGNTPGVLTETTADLAWALLMAAARRAARGRPLRPRRRRGRRGARCSCSAPTSTARRSGSSGSGGSARRSRGGRQGFGMDDPVPRRPASCPADVTEPSGRRYLPLEELLAAERLRVAPRQPVARDAAPDQRRDAGLDEADGRARQHVARPGRRPGRARRRAARRRRSAAAALDVTDPEPIPMDDPLVGLDNCLIVPHIASASRATRGKMAADGRREPAGRASAASRSRCRPRCRRRAEVV